MQYFLTVILPIYLLFHTGLAGIFHKAGEQWWKAFIPFYNDYIWLQLVGRPKWWMVYFFIPVINLIVGIGLTLDLVRSFGKHSFLDHVLAVLFGPIYFIYLGFNKKDRYLGKWTEMAKDFPKKSTTREWLDAILFAGAAALVIRTFLIEAFMIPTTSMESSLMAGDFLFVSKFHYGVRMPQAPISFPFVHNTLPFTKGTKSFLDWVELPYFRLPGFKEIKRNEIVVFNYPDDDVNPDVPELGKIEITSMKQNYIKRCVATPGDTLQIINGVLHIDGKPSWQPEQMQMSYRGINYSQRYLESVGFRTDKMDGNKNAVQQMDQSWILHMTEARRKELMNAGSGAQLLSIVDSSKGINVKELQDHIMANDPKYAFFPKEPSMYLWNLDNFGPLWIPKEGETITLTRQNIPFYKKIIDVYEDHDFRQEGDRFFVDGVETKTYTFEMDYYWMMGDNRHGSLDSRYWGFVPEDHIIGRPWFVLFSMEKGKIRWDRFFRPIAKWEPSAN